MKSLSWNHFVRPASSAVMGERAYSLIEELYPLCRSITGAGTLETLEVLRRDVGIEIKSVATGTEVFDWTVPEQWEIHEAYIEDMSGNRVIDFADHNLHVVSYSEPVDKLISNTELQAHLFSIPEEGKEGWIPYRTAYYNRTWGFCLSEIQRQELVDDQYRVVIKSEFRDGALNYGEIKIAGQSDDEFLVFTHICHPSLCNDNLSGVGIATQLIKSLQAQDHLNKSFRFVFAPATIGSITWLHQNRENTQYVKAGLVLAVAGDSGDLTYKLSRSEDCYIDKLVQRVLRDSDRPHSVKPFSPYGYDERQFCSPGFNLPVGSLMRTPNGCYPEYHTSADNLDLVQPEYLGDSISAYLDIFEAFDKDGVFVNLSPYGEPQLGKRGLYRKLGGQQDIELSILAKLWVLNLSDGDASLLDIAIRSDIPISTIQAAAGELYEAKLLKKLN